MKTELWERQKDQESEEDGTRSAYSTPTKRRKRNHYNNVAKVQAESFVMKLFDRSLDLSKYTNPSCSLYPICRAWINNRSRNSQPVNLKAPKENLLRENNGAELLIKIQRGDLVIIKALPAPLNVEVPEMSQNHLHKKINLRTLDEALEKNSTEVKVLSSSIAIEAARAKMLADYKDEWKKSRKRFRQYLLNCNKPYELNQLIINKIFKSV